MAGTSRVRVPSGLAMSMARPRLMCAGVIRAGLPSFSPNPLFICGIRARALMSAYPIRWVKLTLPPRLRRRWLLMTTRLSIRSLAGTTRTLVAVGTLRLASMLVTVRAAAPRSGCTSSWLSGPVGLTAGMSRGLGEALAASAAFAAGLLTGTGGLGAGAGTGAGGVTKGWDSTLGEAVGAPLRAPLLLAPSVGW